MTTTLVLAAILSVAGGCGALPGASGRIESRSLMRDPVVLESDYDVGYYRLEDDGVAAFILSDVPLEALLDGSVRNGQVLHVELLWTPRAGHTPMNAAATNATIRHLVIADGEVGVYVGAGFARTDRAPGAGKLSVTLADGTLRLGESTERFHDPLSPARMTGTFDAALDLPEARRYERAVSQYVTNVLGVPRMVGH
jgi:hypothetical protein